MLDQEARAAGATPGRARSQPSDGTGTVAGVLPGVGVAAVASGARCDSEGRATLGTAGALWFFALFEFAVLAVLAPDLRRQFDLGDRFLVNVVMAPALLFFVAQPIGNLVDRPTTSRPRVMGAMVASRRSRSPSPASPPTAGCSSSRAPVAGVGLLA